MIAGSKEFAAGIISKYIKSMGGNPVATVFGNNFKTSPYNAAMANGTFGQILDYDDISSNLIGHPSVSVLPVVLALGEQENINGRKALEAFTMGVEVPCAIGRGINPYHYKKGFHPTSSVGIFGATVAAGKILDLSEEKLINALGIASSEASGLRENFGTMTKAFHSGRAAAKGIMAAFLADEGYTSAINIFEGEAGFFNVMAGDYDVQKITKTLGNPFEFVSPGISIKPYPCCGAAHSGIDAILDLIRKYDIKAEEVEKIYCGVVPLAKDVLIFPTPKTGVEGKFSMHFCLALALVEREIKIDHFTDQKVRDPEILRHIKKINMEVDPELAKLGYRGTMNAVIKIRLIDGREYIKRVDHAKGDPMNPMTENELINKYVDCAKRVIAEEKVQESVQMLMNLSNISNINEFTRLLGSP
jgi:2-methylcitrate dehydratase PrpD